MSSMEVYWGAEVRQVRAILLSAAQRVWGHGGYEEVRATCIDMQLRLAEERRGFVIRIHDGGRPLVLAFCMEHRCRHLGLSEGLCKLFFVENDVPPELLIYSISQMIFIAKGQDWTALRMIVPPELVSAVRRYGNFKVKAIGVRREIDHSPAMPVRFEFREAARKDKPFVIENLCLGLVDGMLEEERSWYSERVIRGLAEDIYLGAISKCGEIMLACVDGHPIGQAVINYEWLFEEIGAEEPLLWDIFILSEYRGRGAAEALLWRIERATLCQGWHVINGVIGGSVPGRMSRARRWLKHSGWAVTRIELMYFLTDCP